jgi:hypothetical protein
MAIPHAQPGDVIDVRPLGPALAVARSHALFKSADLEVIEGCIAFDCAAGLREIAAGQLVHVRADDIHSLRAIADSSLLLTIALKSSPAS